MLCRLISSRSRSSIRFLSSHSKIQLPSPSELYETSGRWLYNEEEQHALRRVKFNVEELVSVACGAVGANSCSSMAKIAEGSFNKIFRLSFDNGKSAIARIPSSAMFGSGVSWITASEVATLYAVAEFDVRVPKVLAWAKDSSTPVGSPFIILEEIDGVPLSGEWRLDESRGAPIAALLNAMVFRIHRTLLLSFKQLGSLYFKTDYTNPNPVLRPIASYQWPDSAQALSMGPIANMLWWRAYHDEPQFDRGPWDKMEDSLLAAVRLERRAVERHREDPQSLRYTRSSLDDLSEIENLLNKVEALAPALECVFPSVFKRYALMHPDLREQNIIVPHKDGTNAESRMENPALIDWQGAAVLLAPYQFDPVPEFVAYSPRLFFDDGRPLFTISGADDVPFPEDFDRMPEDKQEMVRAEHRQVTRQVRWLQEYLAQPMPYPAFLVHPFQSSLPMLLQGILRACADGPLGLRAILVRIIQSWDESDWPYMGEGEEWGPCPISFSPQELEKHKREMEQDIKYNINLRNLTYRLQCSQDGWISDPERYEGALKELQLAKNEWNEEICGGPFPFEDSRWGMLLR